MPSRYLILRSLFLLPLVPYLTILVPSAPFQPLLSGTMPSRYLILRSLFLLPLVPYLTILVPSAPFQPLLSGTMPSRYLILRSLFLLPLSNRSLPVHFTDLSDQILSNPIQLLPLPQSINKQAEAIRDFRRYMCSEPLPPDVPEVEAELADMIREQKQHMRQPPSSGAAGTAGARGAGRPHPQGYFSQQQQSRSRPGSATGGATGGAAGASGARRPQPNAWSRFGGDPFGFDFAGEEFYDKYEDQKVCHILHLKL